VYLLCVYAADSALEFYKQIGRMIRLTFLFLFIIPFSSFGQTYEKSLVAANGDRIGFLEFRPADYSGARHPLIIFLHGIGERGDGMAGLPNMAGVGISGYISRGATLQINVNGQTQTFLALSP